RVHADRTPCGLVLHRAGADDEDRQALRMGGRRRIGHPADRDDPGLRLGRRGAARPAWPTVVHPGDRRMEESARIWRPVLVANPEQLASGEGPGPDRARELVARYLSTGM